MNKPLLKPKHIGWGILSFGQKLTLSLCFWMATSVAVQAQVDCNIIMACNDNIQVSLGENCTEVLTPDMILEAPAYDDSFYTVTLWREDGTVVGDNVLRQTMIGETLSSKIQLTGCDISCWGNLTVEDKLAPNFISCISPLEVECDDNINPGAAVPRPVAVDACTNVTLRYDDYTQKLLCNQPYTMTVTRRWIATDAYGNADTCTQIINVLRASIDDITFPKDYVDGDALECGVAIPYLPNGAPSPEYTGYPHGIDCPNINYYYEDIIFDLCGGGVKVLRQWNVLDWCTGRDTIGNQIIKVLDTKAPVCAPYNGFVHVIPTDEGICTGTFDVPAPNITFECSEYDYIVGYKLKTKNGQPLNDPIYDNVTKINNPDGSYFWRITGLPQDTSWIVYNITDACNHTSKCFTEVFVEDDEKPTAICEGYSVVTLGDDGWADVDAISIDDHSKDNCSIVDYQIKRYTNTCGYPTDLEFGPYVNFCCNDVSEDDNFYVKVVLRVIDQVGNFNDCVANVKVQDKKDPTISCPSNREVQCGTDTSPAVTGTATGTDNCDVTITFTDNSNLSSCGKGTISRRWTAKDPGGRSRSCTQTIQVIDFTPFNINNVNFPADITINGCTVDEADPLLTGSKPTYTNDDCTELAVSYEDTRFEIQDACFKITRKWRIADWCDYDPQNPYYIEGVQKITFKNSEKPVFISSCANRVIESDDIDCEEYVEHSAEATDDCTPSELIKYRWEYDEDNNGSIDNFGYSSFTAGVYPSGTHRFTFYATDLCDNTTTCSYLFTVKDAKAPTPVCYRSVTWGIDENGEAEVWASDFNLKSFDLCDQDEDLLYSFNEAGTQQVMGFDCDDIPNGIAAEIELRMYVIDTYGNKEYCEVTLILQDSESNDACPDDPTAMGRIAGKIVHQSNDAMVNIDVEVSNMVSSEHKTSFTNQDGYFEFAETEYYGEYSVAPFSNDDILNGVSTLDLVHMQRHILGISELDKATDLIAADVNADNKVTAADLVALRKVILGITNEYQNNNSWRFIPTTHEFDDETYPWGFPENIVIEKMLVDQKKADFTAVKIGDVNNSSKVNARSNDAENRNGSIDLLIDNKDVLVGELVEIPVYAGADKEMIGLQLNLAFNNYAFDVQNINSGVFEVNSSNFNVESNRIRISLSAQSAIEVSKGDVLFTIIATASEDEDLNSFIINEEGIASEVYNASFDVESVDLTIRDVETYEVNYFDIKNTPNPFIEKTNIYLSLESASNLNITVYDVSGKEVYSENIQGNIGENTITLTSDQLNEKPGLYIYNIQNGEEVYTGKMIMIK